MKTIETGKRSFFYYDMKLMGFLHFYLIQINQMKIHRPLLGA